MPDETKPPAPLVPLEPDATPDSSTRIAIDATPPRPRSRSWSAMLRESWHGTGPTKTPSTDAQDPGAPVATDDATRKPQ